VLVIAGGAAADVQGVYEISNDVPGQASDE